MFPGISVQICRSGMLAGLVDQKASCWHFTEVGMSTFPRQRVGEPSRSGRLSATRRSRIRTDTSIRRLRNAHLSHVCATRVALSSTATSAHGNWRNSQAQTWRAVEAVPIRKLQALRVPLETITWTCSQTTDMPLRSRDTGWGKQVKSTSHVRLPKLVQSRTAG